MPAPLTQSFITGSIGTTIRGENRLVKFQPGYDDWGGVMNRNLELISQGLQFAGNTKDMQVTGTLDFGKQNCWMTRSQIITFFPTASIDKDVFDPGWGIAPGAVRIPILSQVEQGLQIGPGNGNDFPRVHYKLKQVSFWVRKKHTYDASNRWRLRLYHTSSTSGEVALTDFTQNKNFNPFSPVALMQYSDAVELSSSEVHHVFLQVGKKGSESPLPLHGATCKVTYLVANDPSTFDLG